MSYYHHQYNPYITDPDYFTRNDWLDRFLNYLASQMTSLTSSSESKQLTIAYAAGASLAAITLIYVFGPTFFIDGSNNANGYGKRKQTVVGLYNPANDCFVNSVLQALAGCGELRKYLVQRILVQVELEGLEDRGLVKWKGKRPILTKALKVMLDRLNERPLYRKTITTRDFIYELERVFRSRISRNQQDAQEFLQIIAQTLAEEYEAQEKVKATVPKNLKVEEVLNEKVEKAGGEAAVDEKEGEAKGDITVTESEESFEVVKAETEEFVIFEGKGKEVGSEEKEELVESSAEETEAETERTVAPSSVTALSDRPDDFTSAGEEEFKMPKPKPKYIALDTKIEELKFESEKESEAEDGEKKEEEHKIPEFGMPMEGKLESGIQCLVCGFEPKPSASTFVVMTLNVPQKSYATLDDCFNEHLSTEFIDDFQCAKCKLKKIIAVQEKKLATLKDEKENAELERSIDALRESLETDPEKLPKDVELPPSNLTAVKSRIAKRTYFAHCPNVLSIHLSRSIFDYYSRKNSCKVAFPEELQLGPLLNRSKYKLLGLITHRGSHDSGHYECYRRQNSHPPPFSTPMPIMMPPIGVNGAMNAELKLETPVSATTAGGSKLDTPVTASTPGTPATPATLSQSNLNLPATSTPTSDQVVESGSETVASPVVLDKALPPLPAAATPTLASIKAAAKADTVSLKSFPSKSKKHKSPDSRWWRISDDSIKEVKTGDVLGLQKEVYLLFYEKVKQL
ncbi:hypothetical protein ABW20_dc0101691 [Dactylellina cionopaga]|nr:hypothetical protein ABW20_dc0101691 [Dactylellina cionopaga]